MRKPRRPDSPRPAPPSPPPVRPPEGGQLALIAGLLELARRLCIDYATEHPGGCRCGYCRTWLGAAVGADVAGVAWQLGHLTDLVGVDGPAPFRLADEHTAALETLVSLARLLD